MFDRAIRVWSGPIRTKSGIGGSGPIPLEVVYDGGRWRDYWLKGHCPKGQGATQYRWARSTYVTVRMISSARPDASLPIVGCGGVRHDCPDQKADCSSRPDAGVGLPVGRGNASAINPGSRSIGSARAVLLSGFFRTPRGGDDRCACTHYPLHGKSRSEPVQRPRPRAEPAAVSKGKI